MRARALGSHGLPNMPQNVVLLLSFRIYFAHLKAREMHEMPSNKFKNNSAWNARMSDLGMRLVAHVFQRPVLGTFKSLLHVGGIFQAELKELATTAGVTIPACPQGMVGGSAGR